MMTRTLLCVGLLACIAAAQDERERPAADLRALENDFYRAFYLQRAERRYDEALELYRRFVDGAPQHRHARRAAEGAIECLRARGKDEAARELAQKYAGVLGGPPALPAAEAPPQANEGEGETGAPPAEERVPRGAQLRARLAELKGELARAREAGDEAEVQRLERNVARTRRMLEGGGRGGGGEAGPRDRGPGQRGRGGLALDFATMSDEEIAERLSRVKPFFERMVERARESGEEETAAQREKQWAELEKLLEGGKKAEAQKLWEQMMPRRRGG